MSMRTLSSVPTERQAVTVYNLATDEEWTYYSIIPGDALVTAYMLENNLSLQVHNPTERDKIRSLIVLGKASYAIGDLSVLL